MSKKRVLAVAFSLILIVSLMFVTQDILFARANPWYVHPHRPPTVILISPVPRQNYNSSSFPLPIWVQVSMWSQLWAPEAPGNNSPDEDVLWLNCSVDNQLVPLTLGPKQNIAYGSSWVIGNGSLPDLSDGCHTILIQGQTDISPFNYSTFFTVNGPLPIVALLSVQNETYSTSSIPLSFLVSEPATLFYCLDGNFNVSISGNTTLTGLPDGSHTLIVYANDSVGNVGYSALVEFTVSTATPSPFITSSPSPTPTLHPVVTLAPTQRIGFLGTNLRVEYGYALVAVLVIIVVAGLSLVYFRKVKRKSVLV